MRLPTLVLCLSFMAGASAPAMAGNQAPLRISSVVMQTKVTHMVQPAYPESARKKNIQGPVKLDVVISKDGSVRSAKVVDGQKDLAKAAVKAVKKWKYQPTMLNGKPVRVETTVDLQFHLKPPKPPAKKPHQP